VEVIEELMGQSSAEVWACDCFGAQLKAPARVFQLCLQHQVCYLQRVPDQQPVSLWAAELRELFREAIMMLPKFWVSRTFGEMDVRLL
jgi:hypothetical protein